MNLPCTGEQLELYFVYTSAGNLKEWILNYIVRMTTSFVG